MTQQFSKLNTVWLFVILALLMYVIPWVLNPGTSLSLGAYDFSEFLAKRSPDHTTYNAIFAMRAQLFLITLILAFNIQRPYFTVGWWLHVIICLVLIVAQIPPLSFFIDPRDPNQQQQGILTMGSTIGLLLGLSGIFWKQRHIVRIVVGIIGAISTIYSLIHAIDIMNDYAIPANLGIGGPGLTILYVILTIVNLRRAWKRETNRATATEALTT